MARYSIVVPTLNRAHLLKGTLRSLALLDHDSFEVIISNNSSVDDTEDVASTFVQSDRRFKYIKTPRKLCMSDHWEFALKAVTGDYFLYVGDDDSFDRNILRVLDHYLKDGSVEGIYWRQAVYYYETWFLKEYAGKLYIPKYSGEKRLMPSADAIARMFDIDFYSTFPIGTSFCFKTSIVRSIVERFEAFFLRPFPDYTSTAMYLPSIEQYLLIDMPLSVMGKSQDSNAAAIANGPKERIQQFIREHDGELYPHVPLNYHVIVNGEVESVKAAQVRRDPDLAAYDFDWARYFRVMYDHLLHSAEVLDNEEGKFEFIRKLLKMPLNVQTRVLPYIVRGEAYRMRQALKSYLRKNGTKSETVTKSNGVHEGHLCQKLPDIVACSQALAEHNTKLGYY